MSNHETSTITTYPVVVGNFRKIRAGLYQATVTCPDLDYTTFVQVEVGIVGETCYPGDGGWWALHTEHETNEFFFPTKKAAVAAAHKLCLSPRWGLLNNAVNNNREQGA